MDAARLGYDSLVTDLLAATPEYRSILDVTNNVSLFCIDVLSGWL